MSRPAKLFITTLCVLSAWSCFNEARLVCELGSYRNANNDCVPCDSSCATCSGPNTKDCTACGVGRVLNPDGTCLCAADTFNDGSACQPCSSCASGQHEAKACTSSADIDCGACHSNCAECSGPNDNECTACETGRFVSAEGKCEDCTMCAADEYEAEACASHADIQCGDCHPECAECIGPKNDDCTACGGGGEILHSSGECIQFADSGQSLGNSSSMAVGLADLDGDNDVDAFIANNGINQVWLNDSLGNFTVLEQADENTTSVGVALGDVDSDNDIDAVVANDDQSSQLWLNDGSGNFTNSGQVLAAGVNTAAVELGDLDGDSDLDIFFANSNDEQANQVWLNDGAGNFTGPVQYLGSSNSYAVKLGDLDGDTDLDAFVGSEEFSKVWLNDGTGGFSELTQSGPGFECRGAALGDLDGDSDLDVFVVNTNSPISSTAVKLNDGTGQFSPALQSGDDTPDQGLLSSGSDVELADIDADGDLDAFALSNSMAIVWLNDGAANFAETIQFGQLWGNDVALADLDGDGDLDAFVADFGANKVWLLQ